MTTKDDKHFIKEIIFCIAKKDLVKAKALVQFFADISSAGQKRVLYEISKSSDEIAFPVLDGIISLKNLDKEINSKTHDLLLEVSYGNPVLLSDYIKGRGQADKVIYIKIAAELKLEGAVPALIKVLTKDSTTSVLQETIKTLGAIGTKHCTKPLIPFLYSEDSKIKRSAIAALSEIGSPEAVKELSKLVSGRDDKADNAIINGLASIESKLSLGKIADLLASGSASIRSMSIDNLIKIGPKAVPELMEKLKSKNDDIKIHAMTIMGKIKDKSAVSAIKRLLYENPENPNVRYGAYEALGRLPSSTTAISLAAGLGDPDEQVRIAAAKAVDKNLSDVLLAGLRNLVKAEGSDGQRVVAALIDSEADNVFNKMIQWETFQEKAVQYLSSASPLTRDHYSSLLKDRGFSNIVEQIEADAMANKKKGNPVIFAVDDSAMMLKLYRKQLYEMGFEPVLFKLPQEAISAVQKRKPDLVITDLNMPGIDGIRLTKELRAIYGPKELPILMVTTQSDFLGRSSKKTFKPIIEKNVEKSGVNLIMHKPFSEEELKTAVASLIDPLSRGKEKQHS